ncbi:MAG: hypothetical protein Q9227_005393 [Pyrenula ochraceoflavens]
MTASTSKLLEASRRCIPSRNTKTAYRRANNQSNPHDALRQHLGPASQQQRHLAAIPPAAMRSQQHLLPPAMTTSTPLLLHRQFTTTPSLSKKGGKPKPSASTKNVERDLSPSTRASASEHVKPAQGDADDPHNFSEMESKIAQAIERYKQELMKIRTGMRPSAEIFERIPIVLRRNVGEGGGKKVEETVRLEDVATVVVKGRGVSVVVNDAEHYKSILTSLSSTTLPHLSPSALTPQPSQTSSSSPSSPNLSLTIPLPPPSASSRQTLLTTAKKHLDITSLAVRNARGDAHKRLRALRTGKLATPDECRKAEKEMERRSERGQREVRELFEGVERVVVRGGGGEG